MFVEDITAFLFLSAAIASLFFFFREKRKEGRSTLVFIFLLALLFFLEEISFGERIFHFTMLKVGNGEVDGIHDIFRMVYLKTHHLPVIYLIVPALAIGILAAFILYNYRVKLASLITPILRLKASFFILACGVLLAAAILIDLEIIVYQPLFLMEELFEMNAALALVFSAFSVSREGAIRPILAPETVS